MAWARDCLEWPDGRFLAPYQAETLEHIVTDHFVAVRGPRGLGKTAEAAIAVLWFSVTRELAGVDWKVPTTASVGSQLRLFFWPEIRKWARRLKWDTIGMRPWRRGQEMLEEHIKLEYGEAFAMSVGDPTAIEGAHATEMLFVYDEAKAIDDEVWNSTQGAFSTAGLEDGTNAYALAISTPGEPLGMFFDIHARRPGTEHWWTRHVKTEEAIAAGRVTREWVEQQKLLWGEDSAVYQNHVVGEFAAASEDSVIPLAWVEQANERWRNQFGERESKPGYGSTLIVLPGEKLHTIGVDVAEGGGDRSVAALRQGNAILELRRYAYTDDTMILANHIMAMQEGHDMPRAIIDAIGVGAGTFDRVREVGNSVSSFVASRASTRHDISGEFGFTNVRSAAWWNMREMLDPGSGCDVALPPDDRLTGDLVAPKWQVMAGGRIQVESKETIRKRIHRSTDDGDAVVQSMWESGGSWADIYREPPEETEEEGSVPKPHRPQMRRRGWADLYKSDDQIALERAAAGDEAPEEEAPRPGSWFAPKPEKPGAAVPPTKPAPKPPGGVEGPITAVLSVDGNDRVLTWNGTAARGRTAAEAARVLSDLLNVPVDRISY